MEKTKSHIFLDNQSTTRVDDRVLSAMLPFFSIVFGNPSSANASGFNPKIAISIARQQIAELINSSPDEIYFTSGATESLNWAIRGVAEKAPLGKNHIITTTIEHSAVLKTCEFLEKNFHFKVSKIAPGKDGIVDPLAIKNAITANTLLVITQHANNEIGTIQPIFEIGEICKNAGILFLVDAAQSAGKIDCDVTKLNIDFLAASGHKMYAPKGVGFLFINKEIKSRINPLLYGGGHEDGFRSGTQNVPYIIGLGEACKICIQEMRNEFAKISGLRDEFIKIIKTKIPTMEMNGCINNRLPGNINFSVPGISSEVLLRNINGISISKGSACNSEKKSQSHVLLSITNDDYRINSAIRIGIGRFNTLDEIQVAATKIASEIEELKNSIEQF
jgi:cysteine desulfurase